MRLLLDENLPKGLKRLLMPHHVTTVQEMGWSGITNGRLLRLAELQFDALITMDKNMVYQQHVTSFQIGLMVLRAPKNTMLGLSGLMPVLLSELHRLVPGEVIHIGSWGMHG